MRRSGQVLLAMVFWCAWLGSAWAQESRATLEGRVTDSQGGLVPNAVVVVTSNETQIKRETKTNAEGIWNVGFLDPGSYNLTLSAPGFKKAERKQIVLQTADDKQIDITLEIGSTSQRVEVTGEVPLIDTTSATSGTVVEGEEITEMPSLGRIPTLLATLTPGVQPQDQNDNIGRMWSYLAASQFSVNGGRGERSNEFLLNSMPNTQRSWVAYIPSTDAVAQFRVMTNNYDAQYGRQAGGTINMSIKSGTRSYHGNVYDFVQNAALNANLFQTNLTTQPKPPTHYNLYGGTLGGPVRLPKFGGKDKTFFFVSIEGIRNVDPHFALHSVPTALERQGDFSQSFTSHLANGRRMIDKIKIYDPTTWDRRQTVVQQGKQVPNSKYGWRDPFPGDRIPPERLDPVALKILQYVPFPNKPNDPTGSDDNDFVPRSTRQHKMASFMTRLDHTWSNEHKSFLQLRWNHWDEFAGDYFDNLSTGHFTSRINKGVGLDHVWTLSTNKVLNLRYNITRFEEPGHDHSAGAFDPTTLGFNPATYSAIAQEVGRYDNGGPCQSFPRINLFGGIGGGCGSYFASAYHNWNASLTQIHKNMTLHYGADVRVLQEASGGYGNQSGSFDFSDGWTRRRYDTGERALGTSFASFLLGLPSGGSLPLDANRFESQRYYGFFFQNDWRVTPRLTLNMGLRWDYERPFVERYDRKTSNFDPTVLNPISDMAQAAYTHILNDFVLNDPTKYPFGPQLAELLPPSAFKVYGVQLFAGVGGQPRTVTNGDFHEWQPRFGFAYRLTPTTVVRGGFGRFTQGTGILGGQRGFGRSTPFVTSQNDGLTPYDTLANPFQNGLLLPTGSSLGPLTEVGNGVNWENQSPGRPHSWEYSLHLQQEYKGWLFEVGYSHNNTYGIYWGLNQNNMPFDLWNTLEIPRFDDRGKPLAKPSVLDEQIDNPFYGMPGIAYGLAKQTKRSIRDLLRPINVLGNQNMEDNPWGKNQYDAMQVKVQRRFRKGFSLINAFTWSKLFEDTSFWGPEIAGPIPEHKLGGEDRPYRLSVAPIYDLPVGRGRKYLRTMPRFVDAALGAWELSGQFTIQSGAPIVFGTNSFYDGQDFHLPRGDRTLDRWFDTAHFEKFPGTQDDISLYPAWTGVQNLAGASFRPTQSGDPKNGVYADFANFIRRYPTRWATARASRTNEVSIGIFKNFQMTERSKGQFRCEFLNAFNHPRFGAPNTDQGSADFGRVPQVELNTPRRVQLALKINF